MESPNLDKLNLSNEEAKNMTKLMKDPKFMEMFVDYAKEISDPKYREEMDDALKQAEKRGEKVPGFPEGKELLIPTAGFSVKTKNEKTGMKVFINICHSNKIKEASGKERPEKSGTEWDVPYSLAPSIKATDKGGVECEVHDFCINSETHKLALKTFQFKKFIVETAIDAIEKQRHVKLSREFILPKLTYKGSSGEPRMLTISKFPTATTPSGIEKTTAGSRSPSNAPHASCDSTTTSKTHKVNPNRVGEDLTSKSLTKQSSFCETNSGVDLKGLPEMSPAMSPTRSEDGLVESIQEVEPKYKIVYRNHLSMAQFWEDKANLKVDTDEVKEIVLHVHLPGVVDLSDISLDVVPTKVTLVVCGKFKLQMCLKYQVDPQRGQAKFDKEKLLYQLEVILPVIKYQPRLEHDGETLMI